MPTTPKAFALGMIRGDAVLLPYASTPFSYTTWKSVANGDFRSKRWLRAAFFQAFQTIFRLKRLNVVIGLERIIAGGDRHGARLEGQ